MGHSGWREPELGELIFSEPGCTHPEFVRPGPRRAIPATAGALHLHPESRRETDCRYGRLRAAMNQEKLDTTMINRNRRAAVDIRLDQSHVG